MKDSNDYVTISSKLVNQLSESLKTGNIDLWLKTIYSEDDMEIEAQRIWFRGYVLNVVPLNVDISVCSISNLGTSIIVDCLLTFKYEFYDKVIDAHVYTIRYVEAVREWCVVWIEKKWLPFGEMNMDTNTSFIPCTFSKADFSWWKDNKELELVRKASDPLPANLYARAVTRNIRSREVHPELECASVLSNMLSLRVADIALSLYDPDPLKTLQALYDYASGKVLIRIERQDRTNNWSSKFTAPMFSFDEMLALAKGEIHISGNCSPIMSFYFSVLRLNGFLKQDIFQLRLNNYDILAVAIDDEPYLFCTDRIMKVSARTLYYHTEISKIFNEEAFWSYTGASTFSKNTVGQLINWFDNNSVFKLPYPLGINDNDPIMLDDLLPTFKEYSSPIQLNKAIRRAIFQISCDVPKSAYTYAKYAYQTLLVKKPQAYIISSIQSPVMQQFIREIPTIELFWEYIDKLGDESIFLEEDRIMTADQVVRHTTGDAKAKALLFYVWMKMVYKVEGAVIITDYSSYCFINNGRWETWDMHSKDKTIAPKGTMYLAFDHQSCISELMEISEGSSEWKQVLFSKLATDQ